MTPPTTPTPTSRRRARPRGAARREALLQAVLQIVGEVGADAVTHRRVAEVAQLPLASTTYWFSSKEDLLTAALQFAADRDLVRLHALADELCAGNGVHGAAAIEGAISAVIDPLDEPSSRASLTATFTLLLEAARRPELQQLSRTWTDAYVDTVGMLLARAGSATPRDDARIVIATADGFLLEQLASGESEDPRPTLRRLIGALVQSRAR